MKVIILAAGEGTRLRPYTSDKPKCLVEINNFSLLDRQLQVLKATGIENVILIGGYRANKLVRKGIKLIVNNEYASTNMVWTLFQAEEELEGEVIISYGDIVYSTEILEKLLKSNTDVALTVDLDWEEYWRARNEDPLSDAETLKIAKDGSIIELGQKPESLSEIQAQYMGLMKFSMSGLQDLKEVFYRGLKNGSLQGKPIKKAYMTDLIQAMIDNGIRVDAVPIQSPWVEVDTVSDLKSSITEERLLAIEDIIRVKNNNE